MEMKTFPAFLNVVPWSAGASSKAQMHKAWVRVMNIPSDKRCDANAAYAGSLVGLSLEIDQATLHKPEYCRVLIGRKNIHDMSDSAEGFLGTTIMISTMQLSRLFLEAFLRIMWLYQLIL